jgi:tetratricopeptide (TPR) repeat protein
MKKILSLAIAAAFATHASAQAPAQTPSQKAQGYYLRGLAAEKAGDPDAARLAYSEALKLHPNHANARYSLGQLKITSASIATRGREMKFGAVMIPEFKLDGASLQDALDALGIIVAKQSKDQVAPNFIIEDPKKELSAAKISLNLKAMPSKAVLKYLLDQSGAKARYDEHAIVISPN